MTTNNQTTYKGKSDDRPEGSGPTLEMVQKDFVACGRCSFFLAGYRVIHGLAGLETAIAQSDGEWLALQWDGETRRLVQQSFGCHIDLDWYHFESCCPICYRRFDVVLTGKEPVKEIAEIVAGEISEIDEEAGDQDAINEETQPESEPQQFRMQLTRQ